MRNLQRQYSYLPLLHTTTTTTYYLLLLLLPTGTGGELPTLLARWDGGLFLVTVLSILLLDILVFPSLFLLCPPRSSFFSFLFAHRPPPCLYIPVCVLYVCVYVCASVCNMMETTVMRRQYCCQIFSFFVSGGGVYLLIFHLFVRYIKWCSMIMWFFFLGGVEKYTRRYRDIP